MLGKIKVVGMINSVFFSSKIVYLHTIDLTRDNNIKCIKRDLGIFYV